MSLRRTNIHNHHICDLCGHADVNCMVFTLDQELLSTLWFSKEFAKDQKGDY